MKHIASTIILVLALSLSLASCATVRNRKAVAKTVTITSLQGFPADEEGYQLGVSACFAGQIDGYLIMAGGCNFPQPGKKKYYTGIYAAPLGSDTLRWKLVGHLPHPAAYGGCVAIGRELWLIGGCNNDGSHDLVLRLKLSDDHRSALLDTIGCLPVTADNMAVAVDNGRIYMFGGNQNGHPSSALWTTDASKNDAWHRLADAPGAPRVQPVCAATGGKVYVWGGFFADGQQSVVHTSGCLYDAKKAQWTSLPAPKSAGGEALTLVGGIAAQPSDAACIVCLGGVNKDIFWDAISGTYQKVSAADYLKKPVEWYRFNADMLVFDLKSQSWLPVPATDARLARAGAQLVCAHGKCIYVGGELKPSVRTPEIVEIDCK